MCALPKVFIDGETGTTGLQVRARLAGRSDLEVSALASRSVGRPSHESPVSISHCPPYDKETRRSQGKRMGILVGIGLSANLSMSGHAF